MAVVVKNFRQAAGLPNIYRCAKTDHLHHQVLVGQSSSSSSSCPTASQPPSAEQLSEAERVILYEAGLVIDLRSGSERDDEMAHSWMSQAPGGPFQVVVAPRDDDGMLVVSHFLLEQSLAENNNNNNIKRRRTVLRLDPLDPAQFMSYLDENWLSGAQRAQASLHKKMFDGERLHSLRMKVLNEKGLLGLNEAILESGKEELLLALQAITLHLECSPTNDPVVIHCVQGKDRTGLLVMLCQSLVGLSDSVIVNCYHESEARIREEEEVSGGAAATLQRPRTGGLAREGMMLDRSKFMAAPKEVMQATLTLLREKYGSVSPGYLDAIGFDEQWQTRFRVSMSLSSRRSYQQKSRL